MDEFWQRIADAACADVVDAQDGVGRAQRPAGINDFLAAAFEFRVGALHAGEIEVGRLRAGGHRGARRAAETNQHGRATQHDQRCALDHLFLEHVVLADVAVAAGNHDRLVEAAVAAVGRQCLVGAEVAGEVRAAELVVVGGGANGRFEHDLQRARHARGAAEVGLPGLREAGDAQVRHAEAAEASLGAAAQARRGLVTNLATRAGRGTGMRRDASGVVVRLHLHEDVHRLRVLAVVVVLLGEEAHGGRALDHRAVVAVR